MRCRTVSIEINASPAAVYACVRNPDTLARWAAGICVAVDVRDGIWHVDTGSELGTVQLAFCADNPFGVLDHHVTLADGSVVLNPMRVVANGEGSELMFTVFQSEDMSDARFVRDVQAVRRDLQAIRDLLTL
jgi:hypothetical protein